MSKQRDEHFRIPRIACNLFKARENSRAQGVVGFDSDWLKNWCKICKFITNRNNRNHVITIDSYFKAVLLIVLTVGNLFLS